MSIEATGSSLSPPKPLERLHDRSHVRPISVSPSSRSPLSHSSRSPIHLRSPPPRSVDTPPPPDWRELSPDAYKALEPLQKTEHGAKVDAEAQDLGTFIVFSEEELEQQKVSIQNGKMFFADGTLVDTSGSKWDFALFRDGDLYGIPPLRGAVFHSSTALYKQEGPVSPGMFRVKNGIPSYFDEDSGHYAPKNRLPYLLAKLHGDGCEGLEECHIAYSRRRIVPMEERSPVDKRLVRLQEILSAKGKSPPPSSPLNRVSADDTTSRFRSLSLAMGQHSPTQRVRNVREALVFESLLKQVPTQPPAPPPSPK